MKKISLLIVSVGALFLICLCCSLFTRFADAVERTASRYTIKPSTVPLKIEPGSLANAQKGLAYEVEIVVSDNVTPVGYVTISSGTLPAGLEIVFVGHGDNAKISGVPEETGTFTFTLNVGCLATMVGGQSAEKEYTILVE